jgi:hypothetical protein
VLINLSLVVLSGFATGAVASTTRVSVATDGAQGDGQSSEYWRPAISGRRHG